MISATATTKELCSDRQAKTPAVISLHQAAPSAQEAMFAVQPVEADGGKAPEWIHLLPKSIATTVDGRGPYTIADAGAVIGASLQSGADRLVIDENHATDLAAPQGLSAPARGWIVGLEAREDGIWGQVEWTARGARLVASREYRGISPVIKHTKEGKVLAILRASLVNRPNLKGLQTLHQETNMDLLAKLIAKLGLATDTSEDALVAAVETLHQQRTDAGVALQAQLAPIAKAVGLADTADVTAVVGAIQGLRTAPDAKSFEALQGELTAVATELDAMKKSTARANATAFVDLAIREKRVGVSSLRDHYITRHMSDPVSVEKEIAALPMLGRSHTEIQPPKDGGKPGELTAEQSQAAALLGIDPESYRKTLAAESTIASAV